MPECKTTKELVEYEVENHKMHFMEQTEIVEYTGCLLPCIYQEFKLIEDPIDGFQKETEVWFMYGSGNVLIKKDEETYPLPSFIAEFGGCLGLFVGFSFIMVFDFLCEIIQKIKARYETP